MDYVGAIIGVLGTILGGVLSYAARKRTARRRASPPARC